MKIMPNEMKGKTLKGGGITKYPPRKWTKEEINWVKEMLNDGYNITQISESIGRDKLQVSIKIKRLAKADGTYNEPHREEKYITNSDFISLIQPKSILDLYAGPKSFYSDLKGVTSNDEKEYNNTYQEKAEKLIHKLYYESNKYDLIDLDPFGSAYDCFDLSIKMAQKGIIITLGELGHKRFKRLDFVRRYYNVNDLSEFTIDNLVKHIIGIGERNKKKLTPVYIKEWRNIGRVYFKIDKLKITEQWD